MALVLITNPPSVLADSADWTKFLIRENGSNLGTGLSITTFTLNFWDASTTQPTIAESSIIEVGGSLYQADSDTALTDDTGLANGTVHIKLVPQAGSPDPLTLIPTLTNDAIPAWSANKAGWYDSDDKFLPYEMVRTGGVYTEKSEYLDQNKTTKMSSQGDIIIGNADISTANISTANISTNNVVDQNMTGQMKWKRYFKASSITIGELFTELDTNWLSTINSVMPIYGNVANRTGISLRKRTATEFRITYVGFGITSEYVIASGSGASVSNGVEIMSNFEQVP